MIINNIDEIQQIQIFLMFSYYFPSWFVDTSIRLFDSIAVNMQLYCC
uniref:LIM zinc-binding domain-containing protein n=1 Tax=Parascaris univalens TaxID=6257 RepID=A0A915B868_PARUN